VLASSLFAPGPLVLDAETRGEGAPVLVYNVRLAPESMSLLWEEDEDGLHQCATCWETPGRVR
jgi:hypothetical protein